MMPTPENSYDDVGSQPIGTPPLFLIRFSEFRMNSSSPSYYNTLVITQWTRCKPWKKTWVRNFIWRHCFDVASLVVLSPQPIINDPVISDRQSPGLPEACKTFESPRLSPVLCKECATRFTMCSHQIRTSEIFGILQRNCKGIVQDPALMHSRSCS